MSAVSSALRAAVRTLSLSREEGTLRATRRIHITHERRPRWAAQGMTLGGPRGVGELAVTATGYACVVWTESECRALACLSLSQSVRFVNLKANTVNLNLKPTSSRESATYLS